MQTVRKYLVYEYVPIMERTFGGGAREGCIAQRSIYVILRGNEETRRYIKQVTNVMRYLMSVIIYDCTLIKGTNYQTCLFVLIIFLTPSKYKISVPVDKQWIYNLKYFGIEFSSL
jgi:hypothetical protein